MNSIQISDSQAVYGIPPLIHRTFQTFYPTYIPLLNLLYGLA